MGKRVVDTYPKLLKQTAKEISQPADSLVVRHVSMLKLALRNIEARLCRGENVDPGHVDRLNAAIREYLPAGKPVELTIQFVDKAGATLPGLPPPEDPPPSTPDTSLC